MAPRIVSIARDNGLAVILDYGCGKGTLRPAIKALAPSLRVLEYDPGVPGKEHVPTRRPDLLAALDVMEHIEPDRLEAVLAHMAAIGPKAVYLMISLTPAIKTLPDGRNAHLIIEPAEWWTARLECHFRTIRAEAHPSHLLYIGAPL
jgi:hypothetical protein